MRSIESEGDSIDQAIENALRALEVERDKVEVEILADATKGLFGFGGKKARVRATVRASLWTGDSRAEKVDAVPRETPKRLPLDVSGDGAPKESSPLHPARPAPRESAPRHTSPSRPPSAPAKPPTAEMVARSEVVLAEILSHMGVTCTVEERPGDEPGMVVLDVSGDTSGLLIGRRGQTLDAIEYLLNRIVSRDEEGGQGRVGVDVERYRERRREYLDTLARRLADKMKATGRVVTLNPMSPRDRRIVHLALQDDPAVTTRSQGEGYFRKVLILPAGRAPRGPRPSRPSA